MKEIDFKQPIAIISGEGTYGTVELYKGKKTVQALKARLTRERCHGDRWATAIVFVGMNNDFGAFGYDVNRDCLTTFPEELL